MRVLTDERYGHLEANWISETSDKWLDMMKIGRTLNVCSGMSMVGDTRLDIEPSSNRTEPGDLFKLDYPARSFDTVICDPPFHYFNKFKWFLHLSDLANKRLIISSGLMSLRLQQRNWKRRLFYDANFRSPKGGMRIFLRLWWVFDRLNEDLTKIE